MLIKLAAEKDGNSSIRKELLLIDRQIKIEQLNTVKDQRKFQAEYNAEKLRHLKELNKKRMEMLEEKRIRTHDDTLHLEVVFELFCMIKFFCCLKCYCKMYITL